MLTVDFERLGVRAGERVLDLGCGFGRHAYEALRRGAHVVACDLGLAELKEVLSVWYAMHQAGELPDGAACIAANGDATRLPFPDDCFDRAMASEVLEHVPDDSAAFAELARVLKPGGVLAVTVPAWLPERICWAISDEYHAPAAPGGHVRIYTEAELRAKLQAVGLEAIGTHRTHGLHSPYWWLRCAVGPSRPIDDNALVRAYHRLLCWEIERQPRLLRIASRVLDPLIGKSLVLYARKPSIPVSSTPRSSSYAAR
ncbi:MAG TPA: class I SAM-dependent methyltransferase [Acidimicrobiales bacterium]